VDQNAEENKKNKTSRKPMITPIRGGSRFPHHEKDKKGPEKKTKEKESSWGLVRGAWLCGYGWNEWFLSMRTVELGRERIVTLLRGGRGEKKERDLNSRRHLSASGGHDRKRRRKTRDLAK